MPQLGMELPQDQQLEQFRFNFTEQVRDNFFPEIQVFIYNAYDLAKHFHADDKYGGTSYEVHVLGTVLNCMDMGFIRDEDSPIIVAALLHDLIEKRRSELIEYSQKNGMDLGAVEAIVELTESNRTARIIRGVSNLVIDSPDATEPYQFRSTDYHEDLHIRLTHPSTPAGSTIVKIADTMHNVQCLWSIPAISEAEKQARITKGIDKYTKSLPILREAYVLKIVDNPHFTDDQKAAVRESIDSIEEMLAKALIIQGLTRPDRVESQDAPFPQVSEAAA